MSRLPLEKTGRATWTDLLAIFHQRLPVPVHVTGDGRASIATQRTTGATQPAPEKVPIASNIDLEKACIHVEDDDGLPWAFLHKRPLTRVNSTTCLTISRTTLITILGICNGRTMFRYSHASGHRASYVSYNGHFYIEWPLGGPAMVHFHPHDSYSTTTDVYPPLFRVRVDKSVQMMTGVVRSADDGKSFQCAFPGRKAPGRRILEYQQKGFAGAHGARHLYHMMGGNIYEIDYLHARPIYESDGPLNDALTLSLPGKDSDHSMTLLIKAREQKILDRALDSLPWTSLPWSIHRGLKDLLIAYAKPTMSKYRRTLASTLRTFILEHAPLIEANGWSPAFVRTSMPDLVANSVLAGGGDSGDSVRVVAETALLFSRRESSEALDETVFWREGTHNSHSESGEGNEERESTLTVDAVVALTKCFVLERSNEFDYQMYHDLPPELLFT